MTPMTNDEEGPPVGTGERTSCTSLIYFVPIWLEKQSWSAGGASYDHAFRVPSFRFTRPIVSESSTKSVGLLLEPGRNQCSILGTTSIMTHSGQNLFLSTSLLYKYIFLATGRSL